MTITNNTATATHGLLWILSNCSQGHPQIQRVDTPELLGATLRSDAEALELVTTANAAGDLVAAYALVAHKAGDALREGNTDSDGAPGDDWAPDDWGSWLEDQEGDSDFRDAMTERLESWAENSDGWVSADEFRNDLSTIADRLNDISEAVSQAEEITANRHY